MATGAQWDLVQTFGWGRMIANYSKTMSLAEAVRLTFTPENMCRVCEAVSDAKQQEHGTEVPGGSFKAKFVFVYQPAPVFFQPVSQPFSWSHDDPAPVSAQRPVPPTPPPQMA